MPIVAIVASSLLAVGGCTGTFARASGTPSVAEGPKFDTMMGPLQGSLVPDLMLLAQTVSKILADISMTKRSGWMDGWMTDNL